MSTRSEIDVGRSLRSGKRVALPVSTLLRHGLVTGTSGWGKSGLVLGIVLQLLRRHPNIVITTLDGKGEAFDLLCDRFLPALGEDVVAPGRMVTIAPFSRYGVPLNPLAPMPGVATEVQANLFCILIDSIVDGGLGPRMTAILAWLARAALSINGSLETIRGMLVDESIRQHVSSRVVDMDVRRYLRDHFDQEARSSKEALRSTLDWVLLLPQSRSMLNATSCVSGSDMLEAPLTAVNFGGAPLGFSKLGELMGRLVMQLLTGAVFARDVRPESPHVVVVVDEWQSLVGYGDFERLLAQARYKRVSLLLANQSLGQLAGAPKGLLESLRANIAFHVAFRPTDADLRHLISLLPVTGAQIDPERPDQVLSKEAERRRTLERLSVLPPRHALLADLVGGRAEVIRTLNVPYEEARRRAARVPEPLREAYRRGRFGVPHADLPQVEQPFTTAEDTAAASSLDEGDRSTRRRPRKTRPKLELP